MGTTDFFCCFRIVAYNITERRTIMSEMRFGDENSTKKLINYIVAFTMLCSIGPFWTWGSFMGGIGFTLYQTLRIVTIGCLCLAIDWNDLGVEKAGSSVAMIALFIFLGKFTGVKGGTYLPIITGNILTFGTFALIVLVQDEFLCDSFEILKTMFTIILGYTLVIFIMVVMGAPIPSVTLQSAEEGRREVSGQYYMNYLGCLFIRSKFISRMDRFTSVFTEPGVVGTTAAFFLAASDFDLKNDKRNIILLVSGIFSQSLAFIFLIAILIMMKNIRKGAYSTFGIIALILVAYLIFTSVNFSNPFLKSLQARMTVTDDGLSGDNRINDYAQIQYEKFLNSDLKTVLLGYGNAYVNPATNVNFWHGSATYKRQVFQYGVLGFGLYLVWMIMAPYKCFRGEDKERNGRIIAYIAVFVASVYQRPQLTSLFFIYFLVAGSAYAANYKSNLLENGEQ